MPIKIVEDLEPVQEITLDDLKALDVFRFPPEDSYEGGTVLYMVVDPIGSKIVGLSKALVVQGNRLTLDLGTGQLHSYNGSCLVVPAHAELRVSKC